MSVREKISDMMNRKRAEKLKVVRDAQADHDRFARACAIIEPILEEHPGWKWRDAVKWLNDNGLLPEDRTEPDLKSVLAKLEMEKPQAAKAKAAETEAPAA
jgi:hypothetical protein